MEVELSRVGAWLMVIQMAVLCTTANELPDKSVFWTAKLNGVLYFDLENTTNWLFNSNYGNLSLKRLSMNPAKEIFGMSYDYDSGQIILSDQGLRMISLVNLDSQNAVAFHIGASPGVGQLTIDWHARNVYWTDAGYGWIAMKRFPNTTGNVNSFDHSFRTIVDTFLEKPTGIVVFPLQFYLFWADAGEKPKIERSDLVGGNRTVLVYQGLISPTCLTIDNQTNRLFWSDPDRNTVEYINFDGTGRTVFASKEGFDFYGITIFRDRLIFTAPMRNLTGVYRLDSGISEIPLNVGMALYYVDVYDGDSQPRSVLEPCDSQQFDCEQVCVHMKYDRGATCFCEDGYDLVFGNQCKANTTVLERHVLFTRNTTICAISINSIYSLAPIPVNCAVIQHTTLITRFAVDMNNDYIFFTDGTRIYKQLAYSTTPTLLYSSTETILDLDYDWRTRELFWSKDGNERLLYKTTEDSNIKPEFSPAFPSSNLTITSLAVDPHNNHVYWIARDQEGSFGLYDWDRGGSSVNRIVTSELSNPTDIEYDRSNDRLVWNDAGFYGSIRPNGTGIRTIKTVPDLGVRHGIAVYKKLVLVTILDEINHFDVFVDGSSTPLNLIIKDVPLNETILDVHVFDSTTQKDDLDPCDKDNNGCQHLCFPSDTLQCACNLGYELAADGKSCISNVLSANFSIVLDGLYKQIFQFETNTRPVNLRIIEIASSNHPVALTFDDARNTLTWVDGASKSIRRINILQGQERTLTGSDFLETSVLAVDVQSGTVYVSKEKTIYSIDTKNQLKVILDDPQIKNRIKSIALSAKTRKLGWIEVGDQTARIMRSNMNGSNIQTVVGYDSNRIESPEVVKFDPMNGDFIYWCDSSKDKIERIDGNLEVTIIYQNADHYPVAFDVDERYLYYIPDQQRSIFIIDKVTGQEVSVVMETPIIGAIFGIHVSRDVPGFMPTVPTENPDPEESKLPIVPIAAGAGGGLLVMVIIIVILVRFTRNKGGKTEARSSSTLPARIEVNGERNHGYDTSGALSPDPPPRPLTKEEPNDGDVYHELNECAFVDLPHKGKSHEPPSRRSSERSERYSQFPNHDYLTPAHIEATPIPDYMDFSQGSTGGRSVGEDKRFDDEGYLLSSSVSNGSFNGYSRNSREARDFSDGSARHFTRDPVPMAHAGGFHGPRSGSSAGSYNTGFIQRT